MIRAMRTPRMRELVNLVWVGVLTAIGFLAVYTARQQEIQSTSLVYAGLFLGLFVVAHFVVRAGLPNADPWLLPLAALMSAIGLVEIYRLDPVLARDQSVWIIIGLAGFAAMIFLLRDHRKLESYKYTLAATAVGLLVLTMLVGTTVNGAKLWLRVGGVQVQPGEFAKLLLVIFLAGYLREKREVLTFAHRKVLGIGIPAMKHFGPLLLMTGLALLVAAVMNDLGSALLLFGIFLAMLYVATGRHAYTVVGLLLFAVGAWFVWRYIPHVHERFTIWLNPWPTAQTSGYQIIQSIEAIADGGVFGTGLGKSFQLVGTPPHPIIPAAQTDGIYAVWADEAGLAGAAGLLLVYLLFAYRGFKIATLAEDGFSKLLAAGLTFAFTLQAFLIVGGIVRLVPLTGITLPFVSYGGSSIVSNFLLLALLLMVSNRTPRVRA
jgi:cell division protein FtsW (lipid II flippase)